MSRLDVMSLGEKESLENQETHQHKEAVSSEESRPVSSEENPLNVPIDEGSQSESEDQGKDKSYQQRFDKFLSDFEKLADAEAKLQFALDFMEFSLSQNSTPHFKSFWNARSVCLPLFKENISPTIRVAFWSKYNDLSKEARRLKEILDEQSAFAVEQIEMAIKALEEDIVRFSEHLEKMPLVDFGITCKTLHESLPKYQQLQRELNLLNTQAARINALRKELIRTEMRVRQKNKFFQRLSSAGDKVFPRRKELIKDVSQNFNNDVETFIQGNFSNPDIQDSLFFLREEIKAFQNIAKVLTLNTQSFTQTRMRLSECWDRIKNQEKERKKERAQQKAIYKQNLENAQQKIKEFTENYQEKQLSIAEAQQTLEEISHDIRGLYLGREEQRLVREELTAARQLVMKQLRIEEEERQQQGQERERHRRQKYQEIKQKIEALLKMSDTSDVETLTLERDALFEKINETTMNKAEKQEIERLLKPLRDLIFEKKECSLLALSEDDRQSLQQLKEILQQRKVRRQEIKDQIEILRKAPSGLDIAQAMNNNEQLVAERERYEKINQGIKEIEEKIEELEGR
jgi:hypothetical protein